MENPIVNPAHSSDFPQPPSSFYAALWYAAYTSANHEKRVAEELARKSVEHFLPLYGAVRRWKDRRVELQVPLFPGYVFVQIALRDRLDVLKVPGVVRLVGFNSAPTPVPKEQVEGLRHALQEGFRAEPHPYLDAGRRVRIKAGPLAGWKGIVVRRKGDFRVVLSAELIQRSIIMDIEASCLEPLQEGLRIARSHRASSQKEFCTG